MAAPEDEPPESLETTWRKQQPGKAIMIGVVLMGLGVLAVFEGWHWATAVLFLTVGAFVAYAGRLAWRGEWWEPPKDP